MCTFKEEEQNVLVSVTLMKGITGFKELRKKPWVTCTNYWQHMLYMKGPTMRQQLERKISVLFLFAYLFIYLFIYFAISISRFIPFPFFGYPHFSLSTFSHPYPPSAGIWSLFHRHLKFTVKIISFDLTIGSKSYTICTICTMHVKILFPTDFKDSRSAFILQWTVRSLIMCDMKGSITFVNRIVTEQNFRLQFILHLLPQNRPK